MTDDVTFRWDYIRKRKYSHFVSTLAIRIIILRRMYIKYLYRVRLWKGETERTRDNKPTGHIHGWWGYQQNTLTGVHQIITPTDKRSTNELNEHQGIERSTAFIIGRSEQETWRKPPTHPSIKKSRYHTMPAVWLFDGQGMPPKPARPVTVLCQRFQRGSRVDRRFP